MATPRLKRIEEGWNGECAEGGGWGVDGGGGGGGLGVGAGGGGRVGAESQSNPLEH